MTRKIHLPGHWAQLKGVLAGGEIWKRSAESALWIEKTPWLRFYDFKGRDGRPESMFVPNGDGTVEWRLGWSAEIPAGYYLLLLPFEERKGWELPTGLLDQKTLSRQAGTIGMSIPIKPLTTTTIRRGEIIGRLVLLPKESLVAKAEFIELP